MCLLALLTRLPRRHVSVGRGGGGGGGGGVKGGVILGHGAEQECTNRASMFSENVTQTGRSVGAVNWSECGTLVIMNCV